jgi:hypothetical protein
MALSILCSLKKVVKGHGDANAGVTTQAGGRKPGSVTGTEPEESPADTLKSTWPNPTVAPAPMVVPLPTTENTSAASNVWPGELVLITGPNNERPSKMYGANVVPVVAEVKVMFGSETWTSNENPPIVMALGPGVGQVDFEGVAGEGEVCEDVSHRYDQACVSRNGAEQGKGGRWSTNSRIAGRMRP